jgi:hypothetical protein
MVLCEANEAKYGSVFFDFHQKIRVSFSFCVVCVSSLALGSFVSVVCFFFCVSFLLLTLSRRTHCKKKGKRNAFSCCCSACFVAHVFAVSRSVTFVRLLEMDSVPMEVGAPLALRANPVAQ